MSRKFFGTDGVRGPYGGAQVNEVFGARLARAAVAYFQRENPGIRRILVGRDTRASGESLATAIIQYLAETTGLEIVDAGIAPTPAIAGAMVELEASLAIVVTASHNPACDNGFKFFREGGRKLTDAEEVEIETFLDAELSAASGGSTRSASVAELYKQRMQRLLPADSLKGWRIAVDAAHGATACTTAEVLAALGADLVLLGHDPNGTNINDRVGAQHPEQLAETVLREKARLGIAHDGDGDRVVLCDETGTVLDGDDLLAIFGIFALGEGTLNGKTLVATVQSNCGLDQAIRAAGGKVVRTNVGDRYVLDQMLSDGLNIGGETSGHMVLLDLSPSGDGLASALKVLQIMQRTGKPLSVLRQCWKRFPQRFENIPVRQKPPLQELDLLPAAIERAENLLNGRGRVLVRYSGTEPRLRLLVEGENPAQIEALLADLCAAAVAELGAN